MPELTAPIPRELIGQARVLPGMEGLSDAQVVERMIQAGLAAAERERVMEELLPLLESLDGWQLRLVLDIVRGMDQSQKVHELVCVLCRNLEDPEYIGYMRSYAFAMAKALAEKRREERC